MKGFLTDYMCMGDYCHMAMIITPTSVARKVISLIGCVCQKSYGLQKMEYLPHGNNQRYGSSALIKYVMKDAITVCVMKYVQSAKLLGAFRDRGQRVDFLAVTLTLRIELQRILHNSWLHHLFEHTYSYQAMGF